MKKAVLFTSLMVLFFSPIFSQVYNKLRGDSTFRKLSPDWPHQSFNFSNSEDFDGILKDSVRRNYFNYLREKRLSSRDTNLLLINPRFGDNMPVLVPRGNYATRIYKPDASVNYSLLIRKLKNPPRKP